MNTFTRTSRKSECGAANVEAVVALPVFVVLFVGVFFLRTVTGAKLDADQEARRCAWEYSNNGCDAIPRGCENVVHKNPLGPTNPDVEGAWNDGMNSLRGGAFQQAILTVLTKTVLDSLTQSFTQSLSSDKVLEHDRPNLFGGGRSHVSGSYHLACNIKSKDQDYIVNEVWNFIIP